MTPHTHREYVEGCYRCELGRDEVELAERLRGRVVSGRVPQPGWRVEVRNERSDPWEEWGWYGRREDADRVLDRVSYRCVRVVPADYPEASS